MRWKEFLKPNRRKIVLFIILAILTYFFGIIEYYPWEMMRAGAVTIRINMFLLPFGSNLECIRGVVPKPFPWECSKNIVLEGDWSIRPDFIFFLSNYPLQISINVIYWYILSCLIVWIYDKFRKKQK